MFIFWDIGLGIKSFTFYFLLLFFFAGGGGGGGFFCLYLFYYYYYYFMFKFIIGRLNFKKYIYMVKMYCSFFTGLQSTNVSP